MNIISRSLFLIALLCCNYLFAQKTLIYSDPYRSYKNAQELFDKEKYSSAQFYFKDIIIIFKMINFFFFKILFKSNVTDGDQVKISILLYIFSSSLSNNSKTNYCNINLH